MMRRCAIASLLLLAGCGGLKLDRSVHPRESDWPQFGRTPSRLAVAAEGCVLPMREVWRQDVNAGVGNGSPVVADSIVFVGTLKGELRAIDARNGKNMGYIQLGEAIAGSPSVVSGNSVVVALASSRQSLQLFDLNTGKTRWRSSVGDVESSPLTSGARVFVCAVNGWIVCSALENGEQLWKFELPGNETLKGFRSGPALSGNTLVAGCDDGNVYAIDAATGKQMWRTQTGGAVVGSPAIDSGRVYAANLRGTVTAIDIAAGKIVWRADAGSAVHGPVVAARGLVIAGNLSGALTAWRAADGAQAWKTDLREIINSGATVAGETVFVGTLGRTVFGISVTDGSVTWSAPVGGRIKSPPVVAGGRLFVATDEREVICFTGTPP